MSEGRAGPSSGEDSDAGAGSPAAPGLRLEAFLPYRLAHLASLVSDGLAQIYADRYGFGIPEWRVIATLGQFGTMTAKQIGAHAHMHKTKVSRAVAILDGRGWLERRVNAADMREAFLSLTPDGRAVYDDLTPVALSFVARLEGVLDAEDRRALDRIVSLLTQRAGELTSDVDTGDGS